MNMIEKMARAMAVANNDYDGDYLCWSAYEDDARAALQAMLEPSEGMINAGFYVEGIDWQTDDTGRPTTSLHVWQSMIRAALEEK